MAGKMAFMTSYDPYAADAPAFVSVPDLADYWQINQMTLKRIIAKDEIEGVIRVGRALRIPTWAVIKYMDRNAVTQMGGSYVVESGEEDELPPEDD